MSFNGPLLACSGPPRHRAFILVGPTAVGKSAVAHRLALRYGFEILSADSMQIYKGMDIGTAKPTPRERAEAPYWGLDLVTPDRPFSVGNYVDYAAAVLEDSWRRGVGLIVVGGTGLYVKSLMEGLDDLPRADEAMRKKAEKLLAEKGLEALQALLREKDPARYAALADRQNPRRLIRALELAGRPMPATVRPRATIPAIGLTLPPADLRLRIAERVARMYEQGLPDEVRKLREAYPVFSRTAEQAIGYAETSRYLEGALTVAEAQALTVARTRQFSKRQMTWFRRQIPVEWVDLKDAGSLDKAADEVFAKWERYGPSILPV